jgi:endonuclease G, mitochondrial
MRRNLLFLSIVLLSGYIRAQNTTMMLPSEMPREQIIHHKAFSMSYNSSYVLPSWVIYMVPNTAPDKSKEQSGKYKEDPAVTSRAANKKDYKDGGYIMAQFVNYYDVQSIEVATEETFYMTNIAPMKEGFYIHGWLKLEDLIRLWAANSNGYQVVCGPVLTDVPFPTLGEDKVAVPARFYKIVYDPTNQKAVGFILKNGSVPSKLKAIACSVDEIEKITGIDFFPQLDDSVESAMEATVDFDFWNFKLEEGLK